MQGLHLTADLGACRCDAAFMNDEATLRALCVGAVHEAGLTPVGELFHRFAEGGGVTGVVLLAESHLAVHTWPELGGVTIDAYVCNFGADNSVRAQRLMARLIEVFAPVRVSRQQWERSAPDVK
jgi:S-adenosylmethionine decarboxylase proenzyme